MTQTRDNAEASFAEAFEASLNFKTPEQGDQLRGQIVSISGDDAFVSYGGPSEAVMAASELEGLDVPVTVITPPQPHGFSLFSKGAGQHERG